MGVVLALDVGEERIGVALTDEEERYALSRGVVPARPVPEALARLVQIIAEEKVTLVVVGLPLTLEGQEGSQAAKTRAFAELLAAATSVSQTFVDERYTSGPAASAAGAKGTSPDAEAARLILLRWLERKR